MFYERKRKEVLSSTTEASRKIEGDRHTKGQNIVDSKVHAQVIQSGLIHVNTCFTCIF